MKITSIILASMLAGLCAVTVPVWAEVTLFQSSDGTSGTVVDLGGGIRIYSDSHGNSGTITDLGAGVQNYRFGTPHGEAKMGTLFSAPPPPPGVTSAPLLPFTPHTAPMPSVPSAPSVAPPVGSGSGAFSYGAFGGRR